MNSFIKVYSRLEKKNLKKKIGIYKYFQPVLFKKLKSFNLKTETFSELIQFTDMHHPNRYKLNINNGGIKKYNLEEIKLKKKIEKIILNTFKKRINIDDSFSRAVISYRFVKKNFKNKINIFEVGPGSGYLGVLLKNYNYNYSSLEITKPHFIYQHFIHKKIFKKKYSPQILGNNFKKSVLTTNFNIPWWQVKNIFFFLNKFKPEIIILNHCINEMHHNALNYLCHNFSLLKKKPIILIEGFGSEKINSTEDSLKIFYKYGFKIYHHKPIKKYNIIRSLSIPITLLSNKNIKSKITYFNSKIFYSKFGLKKILNLLINLKNIKFDIYKWKIYLLDFIIILKK